MSKENVKTHASILDRLIDLEPGVSREPVQNQLVDYRQLMASVRRDLENLLNTKNFVSQRAGEYRELSDSLFVYGLPDFTSQNPRSPAVRSQLRQEVEEAVARFEPRIRNVMVVNEDSAPEERVLGFRITGLLMVDSMPEPVTFDTRFDINKGEYTIR
ncbi:MAG TPA: type VI secretion system baseplate subunit TssE [Deltaproteobacteria bacterium]|nr:type VI secretion system baseplate subunit TssE [Deltaproteobacteria bacterium]HPR54438.1 type VI secretion system baseplate subunit TssE [Deltaproteobacteria bacterium]HXK46233.1 type VI secretion system baseplate subunit TssE [Deltaproteobacteria bacterium]